MVRTTTAAERNQKALNEAYIDAHAFVIHYLDEIRARVHDLPAPETEGLNWAHVGDMNKIKCDLREIVDFLNGYNEPGNQPTATINVHGIECKAMSDALQWADDSKQGEAVLLEGRPMVISQSDCDRL